MRSGIRSARGSTQFERVINHLGHLDLDGETFLVVRKELLEGISPSALDAVTRRVAPKLPPSRTF